MWYNDNSISPEYKKVFDYWQKRNLNWFLDDIYEASTVGPWIYITDYTRPSIVYRELCLDMLKNQRDILEAWFFLDILDKVNLDYTQNLYFQLKLIMDEFQFKNSSLYDAIYELEKEKNENVSTTQIINQYNAIKHAFWLKDIDVKPVFRKIDILGLDWAKNSNLLKCTDVKPVFRKIDTLGLDLAKNFAYSNKILLNMKINLLTVHI